MDRSNLRKVQTNDEEKRLAFKARLAERIDSEQEETPAPFNLGFSVGQRVVHPSLGEGTILDIDLKRNNLSLSTGKGPVQLVFSQVKSVLAPVTKLAKVVEDPFIGEALHPDLTIDRPDTVEKVKLANFSPTSVTTTVAKKETFKAGDVVWHPNLGASTVCSVDTKSNRVTLEFPTSGKKVFILDQIEQKLSVVDPDAFNLETVFKTPATVEKKIAAPATKSFSVSLPSVFQNWKPLEQYSYLTTEQHYTSEQANDIIDMVNGKSIRSKNTSYSLTWDDAVDDAKKLAVEQSLANRPTSKPMVEKVAVDTTPQPLGELVKLSIILPPSFNGWKPVDQHTFLTKTKKLTPEELVGVMAVHAGTPNSKFEIIWDEPVGITAAGVEREIAEPVKIEVEIPVTEALSVELPEIFKTWRPQEKFQYLTSTKHLTSFVANNVIATINGSTEFDINVTWTDGVLDADKRASFKQALAKKVEQASIIKEAPVAKTLPVVEKAIDNVLHLSVAVPEAFKKWNATEQYTFLTKTKRLTASEANDVIDLFNGIPARNNRTTYELIWNSEEDLQRIFAEEASKPAFAEQPVVQVTIPKVFKTWKLSEQFTYLTNRQLTAEQANDLIGLIDGRSSSFSRTKFEVTWTDIADVDKRIEFKAILAQRIENSSKTPAVKAPVIPEDTGVERIIEEIEIVTKVAELRKLSVKMPTVFKDWNTTGQHVYLTRTKKLTSDEANDIIALSQGGWPLNQKINYEIIWSD